MHIAMQLGKGTGHFRANSKALAELEGDGIAKVLFNTDTEELLGVHIIGLHGTTPALYLSFNSACSHSLFHLSAQRRI